MKVLIATLLVLPACLAVMSTDELRAVLNQIKSDRKSAFKNLISSFRQQKQKKVLACPIPGTFHETERTEPECTSDNDCRRGELCCQWFDKKHCLDGIDTTPKDVGVCPKITFLNDMCIADYIGCRYDSECHGEDEKCCMNTNCHYKECLSVRQNIACPMPKSNEPSTRSEKKCRKDIQCGENERCCEWFSNKYCLAGINIIPRPGFCPMTVPVALQTCKPADFPSCWHDEECPGPQEKCCFNPKCEYHECIDMNADFACPTINLDEFVAQKGKSCEKNVDCDGFTSLCCNLRGSKHCVTAIHVPPKEGKCPAASRLSRTCQAGHKGDCEFDSQCGGDKKCCQTNCGYKQCVNKSSGDSPAEEKDILERIITELDL